MRKGIEKLTEQEYFILRLNDFKTIKDFNVLEYTPEELKNIYIRIAGEFGYSKHELFGDKRNRYMKLIYLRYFFYKTLRERNYTLQEIANISGGKKRHCTVLHSLRTNEQVICPEKKEIEKLLIDKGLR